MAAWNPLGFARRRRLLPLVALGTVLALLVAGLMMATLNERLYHRQKVAEAEVQAAILASTVTAALAFDDAVAAQDLVDALAANTDVVAVGVYDDQGRMVAGLLREGEPRLTGTLSPASRLEAGRVIVSTPVAEGGQELGAVKLRLVVESLGRRLTRYIGIGLLIGMAAVVLAVLAAAQSTLGQANAELARRAADLADSNRQLKEQMEERAKAEEALRHSQKMEAIGRLTGGVAHDFNNLLMVASSGMELLDRTRDPGRREALKAGVRQAIDRGASLTRQLLAFSRRSALKPEVTDLAARLDSMRLILEGALREDIVVVVDMPGDLWPVEVDVGELELALLNIAVNARDAMPAGGRLEITGRNMAGRPDADDFRASDFVCLSIRDTGVGMSPEVAAQVFEPFFTTKSVGKGTGLGLSQVYGFARSSGGDVRVESEEGAGATVSLRLPRSRSPASRTSPRAAAPPPADNRGRILLVEDDDVVAAMVGGMLDELGYDSRRAATAAEALTALDRDDEYDLLFSDMVMPGEMDGRTLAQTVRRRRPDLPVLLTTGFSEAATAARAEGLMVLPKPYRIEALDAALRAARHAPNTA